MCAWHGAAVGTVPADSGSDKWAEPESSADLSSIDYTPACGMCLNGRATLRDVGGP